jgi:1-acyl-sn-glycerol-3-phosphate acyltransferase
MDQHEIKEDAPGPRGFVRQALQILRVVLAAFAFLGFAIGAPLMGLVLPLLWLGGGTPLQRRKRCQRAVGLSFRFFHTYMRVAGLIDFRPAVRLPRSNEARIVVANHPSLVDVTAILASEPELCCVVKPEVFKNPLYRLIVTYCGHISASGSESEGKNAGELIAERLKEGSDILIFPEGTRTVDDEIGPFHAAAFGLAILCQRPIVPLAVFCSEPVLKRGTPWYLIPPRPVTLKFTPLPPAHPLEDETSRRFAQRVREELLQFLKTQ